MTNFPSPGKFLILIGVVFIIIGIAFLFFNKISLFGKLPGDILIQKKNFSFYFPVTTSIVISILLTLILYIINKFR